MKSLLCFYVCVWEELNLAHTRNQWKKFWALCEWGLSEFAPEISQRYSLHCVISGSIEVKAVRICAEHTHTHIFSHSSLPLHWELLLCNFCPSDNRRPTPENSNLIEFLEHLMGRMSPIVSFLWLLLAVEWCFVDVEQKMEEKSQQKLSFVITNNSVVEPFCSS